MFIPVLQQEFKIELSIIMEGMVVFYSQKGVFESTKNEGNIRLTLTMKEKKLDVAKTVNYLNCPSLTLICVISHTLFFYSVPFMNLNSNLFSRSDCLHFYLVHHFNF